MFDKNEFDHPALQLLGEQLVLENSLSYLLSLFSIVVLFHILTLGDTSTLPEEIAVEDASWFSAEEPGYHADLTSSFPIVLALIYCSPTHFILSLYDTSAFVPLFAQDN